MQNILISILIKIKFMLSHEGLVTETSALDYSMA